jgi:hypothetical protein
MPRVNDLKCLIERSVVNRHDLVAGQRENRCYACPTQRLGKAISASQRRSSGVWTASVCFKLDFSEKWYPFYRMSLLF